MLSNEGCEKALARIVNDDYYFENDPYGEDKASAFDKDVDMIEQLIDEHFKLFEEYKSCINELEVYYQFLHLHAYKFEELKPNMWVWDIKVKWLFKIVSVDIGIEALKHYVFIVENRDGSTSLINFEENRFFPVQCANLEI